MTLPAGSTAGVVYFMGQGVSLADGARMASAKIVTTSDPIPTTGLGEAFLSIAGTGSFTKLVSMSVNETPTLVVKGCDRLELFGESATPGGVFGVSDHDIAISFSFVSGTQAKVYSDPVCASAVTSTTIPKGRVSTSVFLRDDAQESVTLNVAAPDLGANQNLNLGYPVGDPSQ